MFPTQGSNLGLLHCRHILYRIYTDTHTHIYILFWILFHYESESRSVVSDFLQPHGLYRPWNSPGQNTGMGSRSLLQGIFPTQGLNPGLPHCRQILYQLSHISIIGYYKILNIVLCAVQYSSVYLSIPNSKCIPFPNFHMATVNLFSVSLFLSCK